MQCATKILVLLNFGLHARLNVNDVKVSLLYSIRDEIAYRESRDSRFCMIILNRYIHQPSNSMNAMLSRLIYFKILSMNSITAPLNLIDQRLS